ncbi:protein-glutamate O-methyltransferase CheR [Pelagicoccus sp. SDUM812003]|uniref:CheR family methyltransferase n=1 Tax=Pelagicoccus sp. SDUM812003 TaxID=3041267 RepID=UPI00281060A3|nr:protein-glutamate O-methyltransferase CheR [Pelagicoccus sp. SDUM812003]MDQ8201592.1 protein-glutamate O-methyltransferase CheR [Pelagicoccus sp. SDUM812003]
MSFSPFKQKQAGYDANPRQAAPSTVPPTSPFTRNKLTDKDYQFIRELIYKETRINLGDSKRELVSARLGKRLRALGMSSYSDYCRSLQNDPQSGELYHLIDAISTNHTFFFREVNHFNFLNQTILPEFASNKLGASSNLRIWSCACSTGEEPYSVGIALSEFFESRRDINWKIECSDISTRVLDFASKGIYDKERLKNVCPEWLRRYFQKGERQMDGYFRVRPELHSRINFQRINLFAPSYPWTEKFQVIFCRNVMIYFDRQTQQELVGRLAQHLVPGGYLLIGHAESLAGVKHPYLSIKPAIYQLPR